MKQTWKYQSEPYVTSQIWLEEKDTLYRKKETSANFGLGRSPGSGKGYPLQYSGLENSMDYRVHGVAKSRTRLSSFHFHTTNYQFNSAQSCPTLCDPMNRSTPGLPVHHQLPESTQTHVHWVGVAIQPSHPLSSPSPPAFNLSQHQGLSQWVSSSHQVAISRKTVKYFMVMTVPHE